MPAQPGSHVAYGRGAELVVEWHDFDPQARCISAKLLIFDWAAQQRFSDELGLTRGLIADELATMIAARFQSYSDVQRFASEHRIPFWTGRTFHR